MPTKKQAARQRTALKRAPEVSQLPVKREPDAYDMSNPALAFAQLARDKTIDADRLEKLIHLQERIMDRNSKVAFNAAFTAMSDQLPVISRKGEILNKDGSVRSRFSKLEDIQAAVKPILKKFGFAIRHRTEWPADKPGIIRIVGILSHSEGHSEDSAFEAGPDKSDYRSALQDRGSTVSYGRRYTIIDVLNLEQQGIDNDGQGDQNRAGGGAHSDRARSAAPAAHARTPAAGSQAPPSTSQHSDGNGGEVISQPQRKRLWTIASHAHRSKQEVTAWLSGPPWNLESSNDMLRRDYEAICKAIEAPGPLPAAVIDVPRQREIGEEG